VEWSPRWDDVEVLLDRLNLPPEKLAERRTGYEPSVPSHSLRRASTQRLIACHIGPGGAAPELAGRDRPHEPYPGHGHLDRVRPPGVGTVLDSSDAGRP
jgi:hypothetical protein